MISLHSAETKPTARRACNVKRKTVLLAFASVWFLLAAINVQFISLVTANPIPFPALMMPYEYIDATISLDDGVMKAKVNGTYTFENHGYDNVTMDYPVPPDSQGFSVKLGNTSLDWDYTGSNYSTVIGDFPMIRWFIKPLPADFNVTTYYEHPVPLLVGNYAFLYAMGTGRFLADWPKLTTACVKIRISMDVISCICPKTINLYTIEHSNGTWIWKPAEYTVTPENGTWKITSTFQSDFLEPLVDDLLLTFIPTFHHQVVVGDQTFDVYTTTNSTMSNFNFSLPTKQISFNVTGLDGTTGYCNITIPKNLLNVNATHPWKILLNGTYVTAHAIITENGTHTFIYFTYNHSTLHAQIIATWVVPEFPSFLILPLFMIATLLAVIFYRRKHSMRH